MLLKGLAVALESLSACRARCWLLPRQPRFDVSATLAFHNVTSEWLVTLVRHRSSCLETSFSDRHPVNAWLAATTFDTLRSRPKSENQSLAVVTIAGKFKRFLTRVCSSRLILR